MPRKLRRRKVHRSAHPVDLLPSAVKAEAGELAIADFESFPKFPTFTPMSMAGTVGGVPAGMIFVPGQRTAKGRTIRYHEAMHLNLPHRVRREHIPDMCYQTIEDLRIHVREWNTDSPILNRDALATGIRDLRVLERVSRMDLAYNPAKRNAFIAVGTRSLGIIWKTMKHGKIGVSIHTPLSGGATPRRHFLRYVKSANLINEALGFPFMSLVWQVYQLVEKGNLEPAEDLMAKLFAMVEPETPARPYDTPVKPEEATDDLDAMDDRMAVIELDRKVRTQVPRSQRHQILASSGLRLNAKRIAPAVVESTTKRLFRRKIREMGGTVVIDASGSMHMSNEALADLCRVAPAATVAYYYGEHDNTQSHGRLVVYAKGGRRYDGDLGVRQAGNDVDYWAIKWLLKGQEPRLLVSDGGFCGGPTQQAGAAMKMLTDAIARQDCEWVRTVEDARDKFREFA